MRPRCAPYGAIRRSAQAVGECDQVYIEKQSARSRADRVKLAECIRYLRDGDELVVASMDRLARSLVDLKQIVGEITAKGASVEFVHERIVPRDVVGIGSASGQSQ